jgi:hypothetical protein
MLILKVRVRANALLLGIAEGCLHNKQETIKQWKKLDLF